MKILDRYVLLAFLKNYVIALAVLLGLYIVLDMVFNFDELVDTRGTTAQGLAGAIQIIRSISDYYFYQSFLIFAHLSGIIPVVAVAFTLIRLSRFNELSAILAAGVPLPLDVPRAAAKRCWPSCRDHVRASDDKQSSAIKMRQEERR